MPELRPPVVGSCREQAPNVDCKYNLARSGRIGHRVVAERVTNSNVAVDGQGDRYPDRGMDGGEL